MSKPFDPTKPVRLRGNSDWQVEQVITDLTTRGMPLAAVLKQKDGKRTICYYFPDGRLSSNADSGFDLVNIPQKHEGWVCVKTVDLTPNGNHWCSCIFSTRDEAVKRLTSRDRVNRVIGHVTWED